MMCNRKIKFSKFKKVVISTVLMAFSVDALASTSGGVFSSITGPLNTVLTGMQDMGKLVTAGGLVVTGFSWFHGGEHKKAMMIGLGAVAGGLTLTYAKTLATAITGGATFGNVSSINLLIEHFPHLIGI